MMQVKTKKVYNFNMPKVKNELVQVLKKRRNESSIADLISGSGLPKFQVEQAIKEVSKEYNGHLKVTESGELLYYFPSGMKSLEKGLIPGLKRFFKAFFMILGKALAFLFKIWIVVMLVGYFVLFIAILLLAIAVAIAGSMAGKDSRRSSKGGGFYLVIKVIELFVRIWFYGGMLRSLENRYEQPKKKGRPLHKSVFAYVFGEQDPNKDWAEEEKKFVISYIQGKKGVICLEELMAITGKDREAAQQLINRYLIEFEGSPEVTENGTIIFIFPELLRTTGALAPEVYLHNAEKKRLVPFSNNEKKTNGWLAFFNIFNLLFSFYFLGHVLYSPLTYIPAKLAITFSFVYDILYIFLTELVADPNRLILISLGIIPFSFSLFFFLIPLVRNMQRKNANNKIKQENLRKRIYRYLVMKPLQANPGEIVTASEEEKPVDAPRFIQRVFDEFAAEKQGDIEQSGKGILLYNLTEFKREIDDVQSYRNTVNLKDYAVGKTVFDTNE